MHLVTKPPLHYVDLYEHPVVDQLSAGYLRNISATIKLKRLASYQETLFSESIQRTMLEVLLNLCYHYYLILTCTDAGVICE